MNSAPIGIFDSGVGGLTVARAVIDQLPHEQIYYVGDTANTPYGSKSIERVRKLALEVMDNLATAGVKLLVIACNTASAAVLQDARERYTQDAGIPVVEVIRPAVRRAVAATRNGRIGVIGTKTTIDSRAYEDAFTAAPQLQVFARSCPRFVEFVEAGITTGPELLEVGEEYLQPVRAAGVDTLVLGCTHYPLLTGVISYLMGEGVTLVSSAEETALDVYRALVDQDLLRAATAPAATHRFTDTGNSEPFARLAKRILGQAFPAGTTAPGDNSAMSQVSVRSGIAGSFSSSAFRGSQSGVVTNSSRVRQNNPTQNGEDVLDFGGHL